jgi:hypothetical protein
MSEYPDDQPDASRIKDCDTDKTKKLTRNSEGGTDTASGDAGEDDGSTEKDGDDSHLHEDQKSPSIPS